jgi:hypothetical protein
MIRSFKRGVICSLWLPQSRVLACGNLECMPSSDDYRGGGGGGVQSVRSSSEKFKINYPESPGIRIVTETSNHFTNDYSWPLVVVPSDSSIDHVLVIQVLGKVRVACCAAVD